MKNPIREAINEVKRDREIIRVFYSYGFGEVLRQVSGNNVIKKALLKNKKIEKYTNIPRGIRVRKALEELGPTFIKLGQILSTRPDMVPLDIVEELKKLQDDVKEFSFKEAKKIFYDEIGLDLLDEFDKFDIEPIAAASIGQVYRAKIDGENVIIKIQRPDIEKTVDMDLKIMKRASKWIDKTINKDGIVSFEKIIKEFSYHLNRELDYTYEAQNANIFFQNFKSDKSIVIPKIHWNYTTKRVLTMDEIVGIGINDIEKIDKLGYNKEKLANILATSFMKQVLIDGVFHGDPHPGNIIIIDKNRIGLIDFGITGYLDDSTRRFIVTIVRSIENKSTDRIAEALIDMNRDIDDIDEEAMKMDMYSIMSSYIDIPFDKVDLVQMINDMMGVAHDYKLSIPEQLTMLVKSVVLIQGTLNALKPDFSVSDMVSGFLKNMYRGNINIKGFFSEVIDLISDEYANIKAAPRKYRRIIDNISKNRVKIKVDNDLTKSSRKTLESIGRAVAFCVILSTLIFTSGFMLSVDRFYDNKVIRTILTINLIIDFVIANLFIIKAIFIKK